MRIQNNVLALNAHRNYTIHNDRIAKAMERLSTGRRINRAADDPAGLAVSERLRMQLTLLGTDQRAAIDYQSALSVADGALGEIHSILNRMDELAGLAANGSLTDQDRAIMDKEYQQLLDEINRTGLSTTFNQSKVFGDVKNSDTPPATVVDDRLSQTITLQGGNLDAYLDKLDSLLLDISTASKANDEEKLLSLGIDRSNGKSDAENLKNVITDFTAKQGEGLLNSDADAEMDNGARYTLILSDDKLSVTLNAVSDESLGLKDSNILTKEDAANASKAIKEAIKDVSSQRGTIGATYNRLEHTINNLSNMEMNLTDAMSRITDADMAKEMMILVKEQILAQSSMFVMTQANQRPNQVLTLINSM